MMYAVAGTVTNSLLRASVSAASVPMEIIITLLVTSSAWHAASATTFLRLVSMRKPRLLDADVHRVEQVTAYVGEFYGLRQLAPFECAAAEGDFFLAFRCVENYITVRYRNQHAARRVKFGGFVRMQDHAGDEHAVVVHDQCLIRALARCLRRTAAFQDLGVGHPVHARTGIGHPVRLRLGSVVDEVGLANGAFAALHRLGAPILVDRWRSSDVHEHAVVAMPVIKRFVAGLDL